MPKMPDDIEKLKEWEDHQFNSPYWINRFSPFFPEKRTLGFWILSLIDFFLIVPALFFVCAVYFFGDHNPDNLKLAGFLGIFAIIVTLRAIRLKPDFAKDINREQLIREGKDHDREKKKKLPKRRKDYR